MRLVQVVPSLPPPAEGVGPYAQALAAELGTVWGVESRFVVGEPAWRSEPGTTPALAVAARSPAALTHAMLAQGGAEPVPVLVHYAGYGYAPRGCPRWLVAALVRLARAGRIRLVTIFHEVAANGPPWSSSFWLRPVQLGLARALARASELRRTSLPVYAELLATPPVEVVPVFSTLGELTDPRPFAARARRLVVFGGPGVRGRAFGALRATLAAAARELQATEILDIGPRLDTVPRELEGIPCSALGVQPAAEVSRLLGSSAFGFLAYPPGFLAKSTIYAAYAAHGVVPVGAWDEERDPWPLEPPCWQPGETASAEALERFARRAHCWYAPHALARQASALAEHLVGPAAAQR
jgi:hypothetical protein